MNLIDKH